MLYFTFSKALLNCLVYVHLLNASTQLTILLYTGWRTWFSLHGWCSTYGSENRRHSEVCMRDEYCALTYFWFYRGVMLAQSTNNKQLKKECASILESLKVGYTAKIIVLPLLITYWMISCPNSISFMWKQPHCTKARKHGTRLPLSTWKEKTGEFHMYMHCVKIIQCSLWEIFFLCHVNK